MTAGPFIRVSVPTGPVPQTAPPNLNGCVEPVVDGAEVIGWKLYGVLATMGQGPGGLRRIVDDFTTWEKTWQQTDVLGELSHLQALGVAAAHMAADLDEAEEDGDGIGLLSERVAALTSIDWAGVAHGRLCFDAAASCEIRDATSWAGDLFRTSLIDGWGLAVTGRTGLAATGWSPRRRTINTHEAGTTTVELFEQDGRLLLGGVQGGPVEVVGWDIDGKDVVYYGHDSDGDPISDHLRGASAMCLAAIAVGEVKVMSIPVSLVWAKALVRLGGAADAAAEGTGLCIEAMPVAY